MRKRPALVSNQGGAKSSHERPTGRGTGEALSMHTRLKPDRWRDALGIACDSRSENQPYRQ